MGAFKQLVIEVCELRERGESVENICRLTNLNLSEVTKILGEYLSVMAPSRNERILDCGWEAYAREEGHYDDAPEPDYDY